MGGWGHTALATTFTRRCVFALLVIHKSIEIIFDFKYSLSPLCYFKEGKSVAQSNIVSKVKAASACVRQNVPFENGIFSSEEIPFWTRL